jgi:methylglutaconyl-CoA hydratase
VSDLVLVRRSGPGGTVARVTLNRPERRNALDRELGEALLAVFQGLAEEAPDALRVVVLAGAGATFCAGADVAWMRAAAALSREENVADALQLAAMLGAIDACPVPVVVRVQGAALGGGSGLCAVGDVVIAEATARFGFPEVRLGLVPATISPFVIAKIGEGNARAQFALGERISAAEARRLGLVDRVVDGAPALDEAVDAAVRSILAGAPAAVREAKALARSMRGIGDPAAAGVAERTARLLADRRGSAEAAEGLDAFADGRRPAWAPGEEERA